MKPPLRKRPKSATLSRRRATRDALAGTQLADTVVAVGAGSAGGSGKTAEVRASLDLHHAERVGRSRSVTLVAFRVGRVGSRRDEGGTDALARVGREGAVSVDGGAREATVANLGERGRGEGKGGGEGEGGGSHSESANE